MATLKFADTHNMVAFLSKPTKSDGFEQIVDFLNAHPIRHAITINPTIYISCIEQFWSTIKEKNINGEAQLHALVDGKKIIITQSSIRRDLQLTDEEGVDCLPNSTIFEQLTLMGGGPRRQETIRDTIAQTRFENVSKLSNDLLLAREDLGEDASKQGRRINAIDVDEYITLVNVQDDADNEMFDVNALNGEEVFVAGQNENVVEEIVDAAQVSTAATTVTITTEEITLAQALAELKSTKPKAKGIVLQEPGESTTTKIISSKCLSQIKGKGILVEPEKPLKKKDQLKFDEEIALKLQAKIDEEERIDRAEEENIDEANMAWDDIQAKVDVDYQLAKRLQAKEQKQFTIKEKAALFKELLEQRRKHFAAKRAEEKRNKPPTKTQQKKIRLTTYKKWKSRSHKDLNSKDFDSIKGFV
ncbi:hypothetical protein Tco_0413530 [Tanacetum coccineum]